MWPTYAQVSLCCTHSSLSTLTQPQAPGLIKASEDKGGLQVAAWNAGRLPRIWPSWQLAALQIQAQNLAYTPGQAGKVEYNCPRWSAREVWGVCCLLFGAKLTWSILSALRTRSRGR